MLTINEAPEHVLDIRISGTVTADEIADVRKAVEEKLARHEALGLVVDMTDLQDMTPDAVAEDIRFEMAMLDEFRRFPRMAVVTDRQWISAVAKLSQPLFPMIEMKVFEPEEVEAARAFAATAAPPP